MQAVVMVKMGGSEAIRFMTDRLHDRQLEHLSRHPVLLEADPHPFMRGNAHKNHHLCILPGYASLTAGYTNQHWFVLDKEDATSVLEAGREYVDGLVWSLHLLEILYFHV